MSRGRVLVIVKDKVAAAPLAATVSAFGHDVTVAAPGAGVIDAVSQYEPNLVLMDLVPSEAEHQIELARRIRLWRPIPILFMSPESEQATLRRIPLTQSFRCVLKPYTPRELGLYIELALREYDASVAVPELEERFFSVSLDMLCCLDFNGYFRRLNPAWERTLGFTLSELMSKPFIEFVHPDDRERTLKQNREVRSGGRALGFENRYMCKDGSFRWLLWNAAADSMQRVIYSVARDITDRKQAEEDREHLVTALQTALAEVRMLREILPICSYCRKIRNDENYWMTVEHYISKHTNTRFSHSICPDCFSREFGESESG